MPLALLRSSMADLITEVRTMIGDPRGASQQFSDLDVQNRLDETRDDIRYEALKMAPSIVNAASTNNVASTVFADYYSTFQWWESDVVLQGNNVSSGAAWVVLTPTSSNYIVGHWTFELNVFTSGTVPGQYPPVFATGKVYDCNSAAAALLEFWAVTLTSAYDFTSDGQSFHRSQLMKAKLKMADYFRKCAKPKVAKMVRTDVAPSLETREMRQLEGNNLVKGL
jgi:hypothetical protein